MLTGGDDFATRLVRWQHQHGRHDLPWQNTHDPYRVWLSEIMLQQTQVLTVRGYYARFLERFPSVAALATASLDDVLGMWSGLGYYTRARNLHRCAQQVMAQYGGAFPRSAQQLEALPGIGRSTAAAIASLCFGERVAILDANVKRVVSRVSAFDADLASTTAVRALWDAASSLLPHAQSAQRDMPRYTQGMMDLGATVCLPKKPLCTQCPVQSQCKAHESKVPEKYPVRSRRIKRSSQSIWMLWAHTSEGAVWLDKRPTPGVWAGLHCFPLFDSEEALRLAVSSQWCDTLQPLPVSTHVLTHKDLHLHVWKMQMPEGDNAYSSGRWVSAQGWPSVGLPAPIRKLLACAPT